MRAEASSARQEAGKPAQEAEGRDQSWRGGGELAPHQLASCETGRITGKELGQTEMSGPQEQADSGGGDVGHGCWGPRDAGWSLGPPVPKTRHCPAASLGRGEAAGDAGAPGSPHPPAAAGGSLGQRWRWSCPALQMAGQEASGSLPCSPTRHWRSQSGLFSFPRGSRESEAGFPAWDPAWGSSQSWRRPNALIFQTDSLPFSSLSLPQ